MFFVFVFFLNFGLRRQDLELLDLSSNKIDAVAGLNVLKKVVVINLGESRFN